MTRQRENTTAEMLDEIEAFGDRVAAVVSANPRLVLAALGSVLLAAAIWGGVNHFQARRAEGAASALGSARADFVQAMGGNLASSQIPEPANPETARRVRSEYAGRFAAVAEEHAATPAAALAWIEAGDLRRAIGESEAAIELWRRAAAEGEPAARAIAFERIAHAEEDAGRMAEAAAAYEQAGGIAEYPLRYLALAQAARSWAASGDHAKALALWKRIQAEAPTAPLPEHLAGRLRELEAAAP